MFDLVIEGGRLVDGSGGPPTAGDVGITRGRIAAIGDLGAADELDSYTTFLRGPDLPRAWDSFGSYLGYLDERGVAMNVVPLVAHGALRIHEVGFQGRQLEPDEQTRMRRNLEQSLEEGA